MKKPVKIKSPLGRNFEVTPFRKIINMIILALLPVMFFSSLNLFAQKSEGLSVSKSSKESLSNQKCAFSLKSDNNIESVNSEGRIYFMELKNNSDKVIDVALTVKNDNSGKNPDETESKMNVNLNAKLLYEDGSEIKGVLKLSPNEIQKFQVKVSVPAGTPFGYWNNLIVSAVSDNCKENAQSLMLFTFIPNPEER